MRKVILAISVILIIFTGLLLMVGCKTDLLEEEKAEENIDSLTFGAAIDEGDGTSDAKAEVEVERETSKDEEKEVQKEEDSKNYIRAENEDEENIGYHNDFTLLDLNKNKVSLSDYQGKIVVLNFWATWCPPCREEIPDFIEVSGLYKDKNVQIIGVSVDTDIKALEDFVEEFGIDYPVWIDGTIDNISPIWGIRAIPTTFILDENGQVLFSNIGRMNKEQLIEILEQVI